MTTERRSPAAFWPSQPELSGNLRSKTAVSIISLVARLVLEAIKGSRLVGGAMMGAGAGTGLSTGICSTVQAAQNLKYISGDRVDEVFKRLAKNFSGKSGATAGAEIVGSAVACNDVMAKIQQTGS